MDNIDLKNAAKLLADYCNITKCEECIFHIIGGCALNGNAPYEWGDYAENET